MVSKSPRRKTVKRNTKKQVKKPNKVSGYRFHKKMNGIDFYAPSKTSGKKYDAYKNGKKLASFGAIGYEQYHDKIGYYRSKNHGNRERRNRYEFRHKKDTKTPGYKNRTSAGYFSMKYLW